VKATIRLELKESSIQTAQHELTDLCERMKHDGLVGAYSFEIETPDGVVTGRCILAEGKVVA
jgi:predicted hotdog family 3-hydroxylacyl-ACP dehydratase